MIRFPSAWDLMCELGRMGEGNGVILSRDRVPLSTLAAAAAYYQQLYQDPEDGSIPATFQVCPLFLSGSTNERRLTVEGAEKRSFT